ncbi:MAG: MBL fold metallo-hydrolase [Anaerolineales bacterium]|nr:MBL fold metallo-hydrolase [Anaerolineales bacterium]
MTSFLHRLTPNVTLIDLQFQGRVETIAAYLIFDGEQAALIETGPASTIDTLLDGVQAAGVPLEALRQIFVTHIHLDHASGASVLARRLPWTRVYVHPVGAPHLADPSKLLASASRLYGDQMEALWGTIVPIASERLVVINDGEEILIPGSTLRVFETLGHARHHHAYLDTTSGLLFTGDIGGVRMPGIRYVRPPTAPPELDIAAWRASIARLRALNATGLCLTHFGLFRGNLDWHWDDLEQRLVAWGDLVREQLEQGADEDAVLQELKARAASEFANLQVDPTRYDVAISYESLVAGYVRYWRKMETHVKN